MFACGAVRGESRGEVRCWNGRVERSGFVGVSTLRMKLKLFSLSKELIWRDLERSPLGSAQSS